MAQAQPAVASSSEGQRHAIAQEMALTLLKMEIERRRNGRDPGRMDQFRNRLAECRVQLRQNGGSGHVLELVRGQFFRARQYYVITVLVPLCHQGRGARHDPTKQDHLLRQLESLAGGKVHAGVNIFTKMSPDSWTNYLLGIVPTPILGESWQ